MRIQHNIMAMNAYRNYTNNVSAMQKNLEKLSSGYKINRAGDDAAGLAISEKMRAQITGLETAQKNAKDGISLVQTAEGALTEVHDMLNRMVELATQSANGTYDNSVDRNQMQKEVDQLLEEIDRIADSSNFNGINLLDGTLGLNTDAFDVGARTAYQEATEDVTSDLAISNYHGGEEVEAQAPYFEVDFDQVKFTNTATASLAAGAKITVEVAGVTINCVTTSSIAAGSTLSGADLAGLVKTAFNTGKVGTSSSACGAIAGAGFAAGTSGAKVTFTYQGKLTGTNVASADVDTSATKMDEDLANAINAVIKGAVTVTSTKANLKINGEKEDICYITAPKNAVAAVPADRPGADIDLKNVVKDGYTIDIDGTKYTFKTDKDSDVTAAGGVTLVDVSMYEDAEEQAKMAAMIVAGGAATKTVGGKTVPNGNANGDAITTSNFKVSYKGGTEIHVDALDDKRADFTEDSKIQEKIKYTIPGNEEKMATTKLTLDAGKIADGNTLNIDGKTITFEKGDTADEVKSAIEDAGFDVEMVDGTGDNAGKKVLTISATGATAETAAPVILGKGLTLQIGDTAESFNQLNVTVNDCHTDSIGVGGLDISTEDAAQAAIAKIKSAVNYISDVRGTLGATQNRLDHTMNNLSVMTENIQDAESTIRDVDVAEEMMAYTKNNILIQSAQAMLAQANQVPQGVLQLLQ